MSNKYNTQLQSNNTDLQAILTSINELPEAGSGDPVLQNKTVTPTTSQQTITADSGYDGLDTVTVNAMQTATQATPAITVNASGLITATVTQTSGYVVGGTKSATKQLAFQAAKTITPTTTNQTAVSSGYYTGGAITVKGDSNLVAGNIKSGVSIFGVNGTYVGSGSSGDTSIEDKMVAGTLANYTNDRVVSIGECAFYGRSQLKTVDFPNVITIGDDAFGWCTYLTSVSFPACTTIGQDAFYSCKGLTSVSFPVVTFISGSAFQSCSNLTSLNFPKATTIGSFAFYACTNLTSVSFPAVTVISGNAFYYCDNLISVNFPVATTIGYYAFYKCSKLTSVSFPACTTIGSSAFYYCSNLTSVSFPKATTISRSAFYGCTNLTSIYLTNSSVCTLSLSNTFSSTKITSSTGYIYVPTSLVASYKTATNWAYFSNRIFGR